MRLLKTSLSNKLIALMVICIVVPLTISILITHHFTKRMIDNQAVEENILLFSEGKKNISSYLESINDASLSIYTSIGMNDLLTNGMANDDHKTFIFDILQKMARTVKNDEISQILLYFSGSRSSFLFSQNMYYYNRSLAIPPPTDQVVPTYSALLIPTHSPDSYRLKIMQHAALPRQVFTLYRPLYKIPTDKSIGFLSIDVKLDALRRLSAELYKKDRDEFYILDRSGIVVFSSDDSFIGQHLHEPWIEQLNARQQVSGSLEWKDTRFNGMIIYSKLSKDYLDWTIAKRIPFHYLYDKRSNLTLLNTAVMVLSLGVAIIAMFIVSIRLTRPVKELIRSINRIQAGQLDAPIPLERADEIGILAKRFRAMMNTINDLIVKGYKLELANKTNQLKTLQAQINPHFINNALQSIGAKAIDNDDPEVYSLVSSLGQMMHYSMNAGESIVPLSKEMDHVKHYLALQRQRFDVQLTIGMEIDERTAVIPIPKMIVQPIVENYFKHGFHPDQENATLSINASLEADSLRIEVADNGKGMPEEQLDQFQATFARAQLPMTGDEEKIGLFNVFFRLHLYYDGQARLELKAGQPRGLVVTMRIPLTPPGGIEP